jgi:hypothetical protein
MASNMAGKISRPVRSQRGAGDAGAGIVFGSDASNPIWHWAFKLAHMMEDSMVCLDFESHSVFTPWSGAYARPFFVGHRSWPGVNTP